jgi:acyl dehydratase
VVLNIDDVKMGETRELVLTEDLTRTQIVQYAGASGDFNPLHTDEPFAREVAGYDTVLAHGMLVMGMTARVITDWVGDGRLLRYGVRFRAQVWPGDALTATATVDAIDHVLDDEQDKCPVIELVVTTTNQRGEVVLSGTAAACLDH